MTHDSIALSFSPGLQVLCTIMVVCLLCFAMRTKWFIQYVFLYFIRFSLVFIAQISATEHSLSMYSIEIALNILKTFSLSHTRVCFSECCTCYSIMFVYSGSCRTRCFNILLI